ncbi:hypothetical protein ACWGA0_15215 [Streptomyces erythrochromogenes]
MTQMVTAPPQDRAVREGEKAAVRADGAAEALMGSAQAAGEL